MSTLVTGTIDSPDENRSRIEPTGTVLLGVLQPNTSYNKQIGVYSNTGNVPQTVTVDASCVTNETGINYTSCTWTNPDTGQTVSGPSFTLQPGKSTTLFIQFKTDQAPIGPDLNVSFELVPVWS